MLWQGNLYLPWQMLIYLFAGLAAIIVVSLLTKRVNKGKLDKFYECLRTPVFCSEPETKPFELPKSVLPAPRRVMISHPDFEIPKPSGIALGGFLASWVFVIILIGVFIWILS